MTRIFKAASKYIELREQICGPVPFDESPDAVKFLMAWYDSEEFKALYPGETCQAVSLACKTFRTIHGLPPAPVVTDLRPHDLSTSRFPTEDDGA